MKAIIYLFSASGNTQKVALEYQKHFVNHNIDTEVVEIAKTKNFAPTDYDFVGIAYPIHAFNAPYVVGDFAKKLKPANSQSVFIIKTSGEPLRLNDASSIRLKKHLKKRGYVVTNEYRYVMPYNIMFRHSDQMAYKMWQTAQKLAKIDANAVISGQKSLPKSYFLGRIVSAAFRTAQPILKLHGKAFSVTKDCIKCGKCINNCPANNISLKKSKIKFGKKCILCTKCAFFCPQNCIKMGLLNHWKVNGAYTFEKPTQITPNKHDKFCKKAYDRYFCEAQQKIDNYFENS